MPRPISDVWEHFLVLCESDGKKHVTCSYCSMQYKHAMANKLKQHLLKCNKCPNDVKNLYKQNNIPTILHSSPEETVSPPTFTSTTIAPSSSAMAPSPSPSWSAMEPLPVTPLPSSSKFNSDASHNTTFMTQTVCHNDINTALARAIYASGQPMSLLESDHWKRLFHLFDPSYTVPSRYVLSNTLLDLEYKRLKVAIDVKLTKSLALALITDGWTNVLGKGVINFFVTTPEPIFYLAVYPEVQRETSEFISSQIIKIINEIGPAKFEVLVTDNAANMKAVWRIIKREFPHISCVGCLSHSINLICEDVFKKIRVFNETLDKILKVIKFIKRTHVALAQFEEYQTVKFGTSACTLKLFSKTRWSGAFITLKSYKQNREALEQLAIFHNVVPQEIKNIILDTEIWFKVDEITSILDPLATGLLSSEKDNSLLSDAPFIFKKVCQNTLLKLKESVFLDPEDKEILIASIIKREKINLQPIHFAAHLLDPRYCGNNMLSDEEVSQATEFIREYCAINGIDEAKTLSNMAEFYTKSNFFESSKAIWAPAKQLEPRLWWQTFALKQSIGMVAVKILSVPSSSAAAERSLCLFSRTHTKIRNRLKQPRVHKLISIRANIKICDSQCDKTNGSEIPFIDQSEDVYDNSDSDPQSDLEMSDATDPLDDAPFA